MSAKRSQSRRRTRIAAGLLATTALGTALVLPADNASAAQCWFGSCFSYVSGRQETTATGAAITMDVAAPAGVPANGHSLQELSLQTSGGTDKGDTVEIGWTVDHGTYGDFQPHLFVFHWVKGKQTCYNGCGFVPVPAGVQAGMSLGSGSSASFALVNQRGDWWASYNGVSFGYFPGSEWGGSFTTARVVTAFGEVGADRLPGCIQMGDGARGSAAGSSRISDYRLYGSGDQPHFTVTATDPRFYDYGSVTATSFRLGGPGAC